MRYKPGDLAIVKKDSFAHGIDSGEWVIIYSVDKNTGCYRAYHQDADARHTRWVPERDLHIQVDNNDQVKHLLEKTY